MLAMGGRVLEAEVFCDFNTWGPRSQLLRLLVVGELSEMSPPVMAWVLERFLATTEGTEGDGVSGWLEFEWMRRFRCLHCLQQASVHVESFVGRYLTRRLGHADWMDQATSCLCVNV